jgi:predicted ATP-grasp superfamily ATP-dependent carboligase
VGEPSRRKKEKVLVIGMSARAVAQSSARAGYETAALDSFGDRDLLKAASWQTLDKRDFSRFSSVPELRGIGADWAVFASGVENRPQMIDELESAGLRVLQSSSEAIRRCRDLDELGDFCAKNKIGRPRTMRGNDIGNLPAGKFLVKHEKSGAGIGVRVWDGAEIKRGEYLQELAEGIPVSAVFLSDGREAVLCGISRQLAGEPSLGARGFSWCGNIMPYWMPPQAPGWKDALIDRFTAAARAAVSEFGLAGASGMDFMCCEDGLYLLEINPRISASFELVELIRGVNIFELHVAALEGRLPRENFPGLLDGPYRGKGIVYAPRDLVAPDTGEWYNRSRRDIPHPGAPLPEASPICTVLTPPLGSGDEVMEYLGAEAQKVWEECGL